MSRRNSCRLAALAVSLIVVGLQVSWARAAVSAASENERVTCRCCVAPGSPSRPPRLAADCCELSPRAPDAVPLVDVAPVATPPASVASFVAAVNVPPASGRIARFDAVCPRALGPPVFLRTLSLRL